MRATLPRGAPACYEARALYRLAKAVLFRMDAERAHQRVLRGASWLSRQPDLLPAIRELCGAPALESTRFGLRFPSPIGLAAGLDKDGEAIDFWAAIGFGFVEVGTVTPGEGQPGNDPPRLARVPEDEALVNRMGFNNRGAPHLAANLARRETANPVGANIGKAKATPQAEALGDYLSCLREVHAHADYVTINVSSPNTPGLRDLQNVASLGPLLEGIARENRRLAREHGRPPRPLLLKIAPDLADEDLDAIAELALSTVDGIIATNTTVRAEVLSHPPPIAGGISGAPLAPRALAVTRHLHRRLGGKLPIVGVGGIRTADDVYARIRAGASLVQVYTALIYRGPGLVRHLARGLEVRLREGGYASIAGAVGTATEGTTWS